MLGRLFWTAPKSPLTEPPPNGAGNTVTYTSPLKKVEEDFIHLLQHWKITFQSLQDIIIEDKGDITLGKLPPPSLDKSTYELVYYTDRVKYHELEIRKKDVKDSRIATIRVYNPLVVEVNKSKNIPNGGNITYTVYGTYTKSVDKTFTLTLNESNGMYIATPSVIGGRRKLKRTRRNRRKNRKSRRQRR